MLHWPKPTVLRLGGLRVMIYTDDHGPAHVHVVGPGGVALFWLNCPDGPPTVRGKKGLSDHEVRRIGDLMADHAAILCAKWRELHGDH